MSVLSPEIVDLGLAIGLLRRGTGGDVSFDSDWFSDPGPRVSRALADEHRRASLIRFVDAVNGETPVVNSGGVQLLKIFDATELGIPDAPALVVMLAIDDRDAHFVEVGVSVSFSTTAPATRTDLVVPLYRTGKLIGTGPTVESVLEHFALKAGAPIRVATSIQLGGVVDSSGFALGSVDVAVSIPVSGSDAPTIEISLIGLRLPGATQPTDIHIGGPDSTIEESLLSLVLGVVRAGAAALGGAGESVMAALDLIGLGPNPQLAPIDVGDIAARGVSVLRDWFAAAMAGQASRDAWLGSLGKVLGLPLTPGVVTIPIAGGLAVTISIGAQPGAGGHLKVTPRVSIELSTTIGGGASAVRLAARAAVDVFTIDLADGSLTPVPTAELFVDVGGHGTHLLATGPVHIDQANLGIGLVGGEVQPVIRMLQVAVNGAAPHAVVDLSSADAVVAAAGQIASDLARTALDAFPAGAHLKVLLGLEAVGAQTALDASQLFVDPLATLRSWWRDLLVNHAGEVTSVLAHLRDLIAHDSKVALNGGPAAPVSGTGIESDPWSVPIVDRVTIDAWMVGQRLVVALSVGFRVDTLAGGCTVVESRARVELLSVDFASGHASLLQSAEFGVALRGRGQPRARLALGPVAVVADSLGVVGRWTASDGFVVGFAAPGLAAEIDGTSLPLALASASDWRTAVLSDVERLVGVLAASNQAGWIHDLVDLLGWSLTESRHPHPLSLTELATDATGALTAWVRGLVTDADLIGRATAAFARVLTGSSDGLSGALRGSGTAADPWLLALDRSPGSPALSLALGPDGPVRFATTTTDALRAWFPGAPGLSPQGLARSLLAESAAGPDVAALARGRDNLGDGLADLVLRAADTDGLVTAPPSAIAGLQVLRDTELHSGSWLRMTATEAVGAPIPATAAVVRIAIGTTGSNPWRDIAPANRLLDLSAPDLGPESFTVSAPAAGEWFVLLASRAHTSLGVTDPSGIVGQAARLGRVVAALGAVRPVILVAVGGAGHAARLAADVSTAVTDLITLGTPWSAVAFETIRNGHSGDAVRLLAALLPAVDSAEPDDADLARGRALVTTWLDTAAQFEVEAPRPTVAVRAGLNARAWFGALDTESVQRALTAIVAAGLSLRAQARAGASAAAANTAQLSLLLPIPRRPQPSGHGIVVEGSVELGLTGSAFATAAVTASPRIRVRLVLSEASGWLIGGPGTVPASGAAALDVRFIEVTVDVGVGSVPAGSGNAGGSGAVASHAELVLHEVSALGAFRDRVVVRPPTSAGGTLEDLPFLPEARAALSAVIDRLRTADAESAAAALGALLDGIGISTSTGLVPDALTHLLHDPAGFFTAVLGHSAGRGALADAVVALVPGATRTADVVAVAAGPVAATLDLATRSAGIVAAGSAGALPWQLTVAGIGTASPTGSVTIGSPTFNGMALHLQTAPLRASLVTADASGASIDAALWPHPNADALVAVLADTLPAEATRLVLDAVRGLDPVVSAAVDALASGLGVLGPATAAGRRRIIAPLALFRDPGGWLRGHVFGGSTLDPDRVIDLFESIKPFVGLVGSPRGHWGLVNGVALEVRASGGGATIACVLDPTHWLGGVGRVPVAAGVSLGLTVGANGAPRPNVELFLGVPESPVSSAHRKAVHVRLDGSDLSVFLRPLSGSDIGVYPNASGLGALLASGTVDLLLPMVLNALAGMTGDTTRVQIAGLVAAVGTGLDVVELPPATPVRFSGDKLHALAESPGPHLAARVLPLLNQVVVALNPLLAQLPGSVGAALDGQDLVVTVRGVVLRLHSNPLQVSVAGHLGSLPMINTVAANFTADATGLTEWGFGIGPASFDLGGPVVRPVVRGGRTSGEGWQIDLGLALDGLVPTAVGHKELFARWRESDGLTVVARTRVATPSAHDDDVHDPGRIAMFAADAVLELLGNYIIGITEMDALLDRTVNTHKIREILQGSLLSATNDHAMATAPISSLPNNLFFLARKIAGILPPLPLGPVSLGLHLNGDVVGLRLDVTDRDKGIALSQGDIVISLVTDSAWITPPSGTSPDPGIIIDFVAITTGATPTITPHPSFEANGVGVRIAKSSGPLLDAGLRIEAVSAHLFGKLEPITGGVGVSGGVHLAIDGLGIPLGPGGGNNSVAKGVLSDAGGSGGPPTPKFSPAIAVQSHHAGQGIAVSLSAGPGDGPWYLPIQRAFGPVYLEQVGLGTGYTNTPQRTLDWISVSLDGSVSLFGISASVDKLRLTYHVNKPFFNPTSWEVDLDGFALSSSIGGLTLVGALLRAPLTPASSGVEYLGMLKIGFNGYGIDLFGGYANPIDSTGSFASFFAFGALHAPLGGPPAFFITGIGIGFGINRELAPPTMENITSNPFLAAMKALGPAPSPKAQLENMRQNIKPKRGEYWVAAGISFTSFVLISGEVVVTVAFGDGLEITLLGLARAELPTPVLKLVSIELALLARFSSQEGTLLVQAQLTENSWLLTESVRLTGGFAFATWWKGPNAGQFVVTMGGYHPKFNHPGYPQVPRLGFRWQPIDNISIIGESYFALCSEALMAGTKFEANAHFGPAYARVSFGADGIVYFDPFWFEISAWAEIAAGIKIWLLFGTVTIELSLGARLTVTGPPIHVAGVFEICGFEVPFEFGEKADPNSLALTAAEFRDKYLRASADAQVLQSSVVRGAVTAGRTVDGKPQKVPDGSVGNPFRVIPEFEVLFITTVPAIDMSLRHAGEPARSLHVAAPGVGVAPMHSHTLASDFHVEISKLAEPKLFSIANVTLSPRANASFPKGVWGESQDATTKQVPAGKTVDASDGFSMNTALGDLTGAPQIDYHQVEIRLDRKRKPLPFVTNAVNANARRADSAQMRALADGVRPPNSDLDGRFNVAARLLQAGGYGPLGVAALRGERAAAPSFGSLADDLVKAPMAVSPRVRAVVVDHARDEIFVAPLVTSILSSSATTALSAAARTTVSEPGRAVPRIVPSLESMRTAVTALAPASLLVRPPIVIAKGRRGASPIGGTPVTRLATGAVAAVGNARPDAKAQQRLADMTRGLNKGITLREGELTVLSTGSRPNGGRRHQLRVGGGSCRVIALAAGGNVLFDNIVGAAGRQGETIDVPVKAERVVVVAPGDRAAVGGTVDGWYAGESLPLIGWDMALAAAAIVRFEGNRVGSNRERANGGWANTRELSRSARIVTRFDNPIRCVAIALDDPTIGGRADAASTLNMRLVGASRVLDAVGEPRAPTVLVHGVRSILVFPIEPDAVNPDAPPFDPNVLVIVDNTGAGHLAGVAGSVGSIDELITTLSVAGFDAAIAAALPGGTGTRSIAWRNSVDPATGRSSAPVRRTTRGTTGRTTGRTTMTRRQG